MKFNSDKYFYLRNIKVSITLSLVLIIIAFLILPGEKINRKKTVSYSEPLIKLMQIPSTKISLPTKSKSFNPELKIFIDEPDILPDVTINDEKKVLNDDAKISGNGLVNYNEDLNIERETFIISEQLIEVLPQNEEGIKGTIKFELLITGNGDVKEYRILSNTLNSEEKTSEIINAVLKSKWQPSPYYDSEIEYRIEKTYKFN